MPPKKRTAPPPSGDKSKGSGSGGRPKPPASAVPPPPAPAATVKAVTPAGWDFPPPKIYRIPSRFMTKTGGMTGLPNWMLVVNGKTVVGANIDLEWDPEQNCPGGTFDPPPDHILEGKTDDMHAYFSSPFGYGDYGGGDRGRGRGRGDRGGGGRGWGGGGGGGRGVSPERGGYGGGGDRGGYGGDRGGRGGARGGGQFMLGERPGGALGGRGGGDRGGRGGAPRGGRGDRGGGGYSGPGRGGGGGGAGVCNQYQSSGGCRFGDSCRFKHE